MRQKKEASNKNVKPKKLISRTIRIDLDVYELINKNVHTIGDTPNKILRRLLKLDQTKQ